MRFKFLYIVACVSSFTFAQQKKGEPKPVFHEVSNKNVVQSVFPEATKVEKENEFWFKIIDQNNKIIGYALSSAPYCKEIIGYNNTTPVLIVADKNMVIKKTALLSNWETIGYVKKLENKGFFDLWTGKSIKQAKTVEIDGYTGATVTAKAVGKNISFILENGLNNMPRKRK